MMDKPDPRPSQGYMTEERVMIQQMARDFAVNEVLPIANALDPEKGEIPQDLVDRMGELGFFGILIPESYGGLGLGFFEYCLVAEELSRAWMSVGSLIARGNLFYKSVPGLTEEERDERIRRMAKGQYLGAFSMSEPSAGSDVAAVQCKAVRDGDEWVVTGSKYWCTFADRADFMQVVCRTENDPDAPRWAGLTSLTFEKPRGEFPQGVSGNAIPKIGYHGWKTFELAFDGARTPAGPKSDAEGNAFKAIVSGLEGARAHTAARSIGLARGALEDAIAFAKEREQFGEPIANFQAIRFKIATMATEVEAARQLMYFVCNELDSGRRCDKEASMVKYYAAEMAERVTSEALQILGGAGYTTLHAVERHWRDARLTKIFEGSSEIQQRIISDVILGKPVPTKAS
ncbi:acyl-CoA dehydrogenase family protein [Pontixanthobacter aquaemixtae]|uniref:Acyl-CoA dehydrogenase n=1 Tax=Pontixanthobacter aquaemixtae TaxID=1958940 RepID=A0A844ZZX7_9SPHN|nr:acyl-CoA dehydrogenase family protein [Pontixanthobacter aquaemixtae]MXO90989.1 acyl-CoA dehydrogenase [Pontixanthobacter aquaemixtae]